ncbi:phosphonate ABC transporter, permease protein PhnE [Erysipelothrix sp. HDW6C]|uniref:phosphonate ABC transporter, permease protein PhnE n=1 Tax=Erysipelothrix sp. HDW6C TaxID=2714930 RepID=UPI00140E8446|nr:phosphonate ABC transporter, permease protein PhnE [Erysipelothrix sp. HDW6C]QIK70626.1 phosphonate ABC transporter, permease protein PhnE [Erysipelothrix sp. HDW6C]
MKLKDTVHYKLPKQIMTTLLVLVLVSACISLTDASLFELLGNLDQMVLFLKRFMQPDFSYVPQLINPVIKTIQMSIVGTVLGTAFAIPFAFLATKFATENNIFSQIIRFLLGIVRTVPNLLLAALFVAIIGIGEVTGILTIAVFTFGMVSQLIYESIETIDLGPIEATKSIGASRLQTAGWAIFPQVLPSIISYAIYAVEVNVRASTILGYVGAGGIGVLLSTALAQDRYDRVSVIIIIILAIVFLCDAISESLRKKVM